MSNILKGRNLAHFFKVKVSTLTSFHISRDSDDSMGDNDSDSENAAPEPGIKFEPGIKIEPPSLVPVRVGKDWASLDLFAD